MSKMGGYQLTRFDTHHPLVSRHARRTGRLIREKWSDTLEREWNAGKEWRLLRPGPLKVWDDPMRWPALLRLTWHRSANWSSGENKAERERERECQRYHWNQCCCHNYIMIYPHPHERDAFTPNVQRCF